MSQARKYWSWWPFLSPGHLPGPGIKPASPALQADSLHLSHQGSPVTQVSAQILLILSKITSPSPPHHSLSISSVWISSRNSFQNLYFDFYLFVFFFPTKIGALWWQRFLSVCSALNPQHIRIVLAHVRTMIAEQRNIFVMNAYED